MGEQLAKAESEFESYTREHNTVGLDQRASEEVLHVANLRAQREQLEVEKKALARFIQIVERREGDPSQKLVPC